VRFFGLHVVHIAVDVGHAGVIHGGNVALGVGNGVHQADLRRADRLDGRLDLVLHEQVGHQEKCLDAALEFNGVVGFGAAHCARHDQQIRAADRRREGDFAFDVVYGCLALQRAVAGQVVVGGEHAAHAADFDPVIAQNLERFVHLVAEVGAVVVAVQLDPADARALQTSGGVGQRLDAESPVAPREVQARLELLRVFFFESGERGPNLLGLQFVVLRFHFCAPCRGVVWGMSG